MVALSSNRPPLAAAFRRSTVPSGWPGRLRSAPRSRPAAASLTTGFGGFFADGTACFPVRRERIVGAMRSSHFAAGAFARCCFGCFGSFASAAQETGGGEEPKNDTPHHQRTWASHKNLSSREMGEMQLVGGVPDRRPETVHWVAINCHPNCSYTIPMVVGMASRGRMEIAEDSKRRAAGPRADHWPPTIMDLAIAANRS